MTLSSDHQASRSMHKKRSSMVKRAGCANGLYSQPTSSTTSDASVPLQIQWDTTCFTDSPQAVDIYMTAPYASNPTVYTWYSVENNGSYSPSLKPRWWNATTSVTLQLNIIESGTPSFLTQFPAGPLFTVTYNPASDANAANDANTNVKESPYQVVDNWIHKTGLTGGQLAAAVLLPLLAVAGGVAFYIRWSRAKELKKRQRWSKAVDKRMSMVSQDWKSMSGAAASAAIRHSMVGTGDRGTKASSFFAGNGPLPGMAAAGRSSASIDGQGARYNNGLGLGGNQMNDSTDDMIARLRRPADAITPNPAARVSRVSFATDAHPRSSLAETRTSIYTQGTGTRTSRAFHKSWYALDGEDVPPVPERKDKDIEMSPTQTDGPEALSPYEIRAKIAADSEARPSLDVGLLKMPAMTLMRTSEASNEYTFPQNSPTQTIDYPVTPAPEPAVLSPTTTTSNNPFVSSPSPPPGMFGGMTTLPADESANFMSPDAMLKAYAQNRKQSTTSTTASTPTTGKFASVTGLVIKKRSTSNLHAPPTPAVPTTTSANGGMRVLYAPSEEAYADDAYTYTGTHGGTDSYAPSTEEGVVTYGSRATYLGPSGVDEGNPFRITSTSGYSDVSGASRYSSAGQEEAK